MKRWTQRSLIALTSVTVLLGGLTACSHRGDHSRSTWGDERITQMRAKVVNRISSKLDLSTEQRAKLDILADQMSASRKAFRGDTDTRADMQSLIASNQFDRTQAQQMLDQKLQAAKDNGPQLLTAFGDFFDSLNPEQQKQVRERLEKRRHGWGGRG